MIFFYYMTEYVTSINTQCTQIAMLFIVTVILLFNK